MSDLDRIAVGASPCAFCQAAPGVPCTSPRSGKRARYTHAARAEAVRLGYLLGYREGSIEVLDRIDAVEPTTGAVAIALDRLRRTFG